MGGLNSGYGLGTSGGVSGGGKAEAVKSITQSLSSGSNTITHSLGSSLTVNDVNVFDSTGKIYYQVEWNIIDSDSINIILSGGSITNAVIRISYF